MLIASCANADDCDYIKKLRLEAASDFRSMQKISNDPTYVPSSFSLPGTTDCEIHLGLSEYYCHWYLSRGEDGEAKARAAFEAVFQTIQQCVDSPMDTVREPQRRTTGEIAYIADKLSWEDPKISRVIEISYEKDGRWWMLQFVYRYEKEDK